MGIEYTSGEDETNNRHLAEAIDLTREGMAPVGGQYDDPMGRESPTNRESCFYSALDALRRIESAPADSQETINEVIRKLDAGQHASLERQQQVMAEAHDTLQDVWAPPTN